jgi:(2R)-3-sulfolactate dehydrogenase (NADP+)
MNTVNLSLDSLQALAEAILVAHDTSATNAEQVATALVAAESDGQQGHGASRIPSYAAQAKSGKVDGHATPLLQPAGDAAVTIDAAHGFAYPALNLAFDALCELVPKCGIAAAAITRSHHSGVAGHQVERLADRGLIGLCFCNTPQGIAPWGGNRGVFGTNPIAFAAPRPGFPPLVIDMSLSKVARGKINVAAQRGESIPEGWAVDSNGAPTTDPNAAMQGTLLPMGDAKGAQLVLMVEVLAAALTASNRPAALLEWRLCRPDRGVAGGDARSTGDPATRCATVHPPRCGRTRRGQYTASALRRIGCDARSGVIEREIQFSICNHEACGSSLRSDRQAECDPHNYEQD